MSKQQIKASNQNPLRLPWKMFGEEINGFGVTNCDGICQIDAQTLNLAQAVAIVRGVNHTPDLLAALETIVRHNYPNITGGDLAMMHAAISKAKGKNP